MLNTKSRLMVLIVVIAGIFLVGYQTTKADNTATLLAPLTGAEADGVLPDQYIVVFKNGTANQAVSSAVTAVEAAGGKVAFVYGTALQGFAGYLPARALETIRKDPNVAYVEADHIMFATDVTSWGLDRIDQRNLPLNDTYNAPATGAGVSAYIIDTGIRKTHVDLGGRAFHGFTAINDGNGSDDCNGHGTHVSGTVGGETYGVAPDVLLYAVRVLGCAGSGATSGVIAGVDWVAANGDLPAVANMSLGGSPSASLDTSVENAIAAGVTFAVAAGNSDADACDSSPARTPSALTVGATEIDDTRASFSNWGPCLDLFAPGVDITSAWNSSDTASNTISGTSMASPHVAGVAALVLDLHPAYTAAQVMDTIIDSATRGVVIDNACSQNLMVYAQLTPDPNPIPDPGPCDGGGGGGCAADTVLADRNRFSPLAALSVADSIYRFRDYVLTGSDTGRNYLALYASHTERISELLLQSPRLRALASNLLVAGAPGLDQISGASTTDVTLTAGQTLKIRIFLVQLATYDRQMAGGELADAIEAEMAKIDWNGIAGKSYADAWQLVISQ